MAFVLSNITSVLSLLQWRAFAFQPALTTDDLTPTGWSASGLPPGLSIHATTGLISGVPVEGGIFNARIRAFSGLTTAVLDVVFGVELTSVSADSALDLWIDLVTRKVSVLEPVSTVKPTDAEVAEAKARLAAGIKEPLFYAKSGSDLICTLRFMKDGAVVDLDLAALALWVKEVGGDAPILRSGGWKKLGAGEYSRFVFHLAVRSELLDAAFLSYEADAGTLFRALSEIEWVEARRWYPGGPVTQLRQTTGNFIMEIERSLGVGA